MNYLLSKDPIKSLYGESCTSTYFGFCTKSVKGENVNLQVTGDMQVCRGFLNDGLAYIFKGKGYNNYLPSSKLLGYNRMYLLLKRSGNFGDLKPLIKIFNDIENKLHWNRTYLYDTNFSKCKLIIASKNWFKNPIIMSLYMLLIRNAPCIKDSYKYSTLKGFIDIIANEPINKTENSRYDDVPVFKHLSKHYDIVEAIINNHKPLSEAYNWKELEQSHDSGIGSLLNIMRPEPYTYYSNLNAKTSGYKTYGVTKYVEVLEEALKQSAQS